MTSHDEQVLQFGSRWRQYRGSPALLRHAPAVAAVLIGLGLATPSHGAGVTAHVVAGEMVIDQIEDGYLKNVLKQNRDAFLSGTAIPDELLQIEQTTQNIDSHFGSFSHGISQKLADPPRGYEHQLWSMYKQCAAKQPPNGARDCEPTLALLMGILTHEITDAPWHNQFIDTSSAGMCEPCLSGTSASGYKSYLSCQPGGAKVYRDSAEPHNVTSGLDGRHIVADTGFDLCLASQLGGNHGDLPTIQNPALVTPATFVSREQKVCPSGSFFDPRNGGECWQCGSGTVRTGDAVDSNKACTTNLGGLALKTADREGKTGCNDGEFQNAAGTGCYACPGGYHHNSILTVDTSGVCTKPGDHWYDSPSNRKADYQHSYGGCSGSQFKNTDGSACYSCPSGYQHNPAFTVDTSGVCFKSETLSNAKFIAKASLCPSGGFVEPFRKGGECWSCPSGYIRNLLQSDVSKDNACTKPGLARCSLVRPPSGATGKLPALPQAVYPALTEALKRAAVSSVPVNALTIQGVVTGLGTFRSNEPTLASTLATPAVAVCSDILAHGFDGEGALNDSAREAARFLNALWKNRTVPGVTVISFSDYEKAIVSGQTVLHRDWHRTCDSDSGCGSDQVCVNRSCQYNMGIGSAPSSTASVPAATLVGALPAKATLVISGGVNGPRRFLSVPNDGSMADLYTKDDGSGHQRWLLQLSSDRTTYNILVSGGVSGGRKYLSTTADGTKVDLYTQDVKIFLLRLMKILKPLNT